MKIEGFPSERELGRTVLFERKLSMAGAVDRQASGVPRLIFEVNGAGMVGPHFPVCEVLGFLRRSLNFP